MARRIRRARARRASPFRSAPRRRSSRSGGSTDIVQIDSMLYGAGRDKVYSMVGAYLPNVLGNYQKIGVMATLSWLAAKKGSGIISSVGKRGLTIENYNLGQAAGGQLLGGTTTASTGSNNQTFI